MQSVSPADVETIENNGNSLTTTAAAAAMQQPVYEVLINEEDKDLPKKLFQVSVAFLSLLLLLSLLFSGSTKIISLMVSLFGASNGGSLCVYVC